MAPMHKPEPQKEHQWLQRLLGNWTFEGDATMGPDQPPMKFSGTERVRALGDVWVIAEGEGAMPGGGSSSSMMTLGYDPKKQRFTGTYLGSMMTSLWIYDGTLDGDRLVLDTEGPGMSDGTTARYRDTITLDGDQRTLTSEIQGDDGGWTQIMKMTYTRA
jgi:hypothetical protein